MKTIEIVHRTASGERKVQARLTLGDDDSVDLEVFTGDVNTLASQLRQILSGPPDWRTLTPDDGRAYWDGVLREFKGQIEFV